MYGNRHHMPIKKSDMNMYFVVLLLLKFPFTDNIDSIVHVIYLSEKKRTEKTRNIFWRWQKKKKLTKEQLDRHKHDLGRQNDERIFADFVATIKTFDL